MFLLLNSSVVELVTILTKNDSNSRAEGNVAVNENENFTLNYVLAIGLGVGFGIVVILGMVLGGLFIHYRKIRMSRPVTPDTVIPAVANNPIHLSSPPSVDRTRKPKRYREKSQQQQPAIQNGRSQPSTIFKDSSSADAANTTGLNNNLNNLIPTNSSQQNYKGVYCNPITSRESDDLRSSVVIYAVFGRSAQS